MSGDPNTQPTQTTHVLRVRGRRIRVQVRAGDGSRTPLLLCNGIGAPLEVLQPFVDALDPTREVIRFDVPGVGGSAQPIWPYTLGTLSLTVAGILDQIGETGAVDVMGFSWGGGLAQHFAVQHRRRCRRLVLAATGTGVLMVPGHPTVLARMATPRRHRQPDYAAKIAAHIYGGTLRTHPERATEILHGLRAPGTTRGYYYQLASAAAWTSLPFLRLIRQPTLIISGDDDPIIPTANPRLMSRAIPHATLHLHHGGHLALLTDPDDLAPVIDQFLA